MKFAISIAVALALSISAQSDAVAGTAHVTCSNGCNVESFNDQFCTKMGGGMSSNPDGTYTCSVNTSRAQRGFVKFASTSNRRRSAPNSLSANERRPGGKAGIVYDCKGDQKYCSTQFVTTCTKSGGSPSTGPSGTVSCEVEPNQTKP
jgi:hypothetical protein